MKYMINKDIMIGKFLIAVLLALPVYAVAQIQSVTPVFKGNMSQYEKSEWDITLKCEWGNPYDASQVALDMCFQAPDGKTDSLPCFYVSGESGKPSLWKARFAPLHRGTYKIWFALKAKNMMSESRKRTFTCVASDNDGFLHPGDNYWNFRFDSGKSFRGIGENIGWESRDVDDSKYFSDLHQNPRFNYDYMLHKLAASGGNFFRTWMIYWNLPVDWKTVQNNSRYTSGGNPFNISAMKRMDHLVDLCDSLGVYMMLTLESHVGLMGDGWKISNYNIVNGGFATTPKEIFANQKSRAQYKNKLRLMIARYGYSRSIAVWEFFNEVDHVRYDTSFGESLNESLLADWHNDMAGYLKTHDPYHHIISTSVSHRDNDAMNRLETLDFNQRHIYGNAFTIPGTIRDYENKYGKPYVIGETGYSWDWSLNFNQYATEFDRDFRRTLWLGLFSPNRFLPMSWWWEFFENRGMMTYFSVVRRISDDMQNNSNGESYSEVTVEAPASVGALGVRCGKKTYLYVYNQKNQDASVDKLLLYNTNDKALQMIAYDTMAGRFNHKGQIVYGTDGVMKVPEFKLQPFGDIVIVLTGK